MDNRENEIDLTHRLGVLTASEIGLFGPPQAAAAVDVPARAAGPPAVETAAPPSKKSKKDSVTSPAGVSPAAPTGLLKEIADLLAPAEPVRADSSDLERRISVLDARIEEAKRELAGLEQGRKAILLADDDDKAEQHDAKIRGVQRRIERFLAEREVLAEEHNAKLVSEAGAARNGIRTRLEQATELLGRWLLAVYAPHAAEIAAGMVQWQAVTRAVESFNRASGGRLLAPEHALRDRGTRKEKAPTEIRLVPYHMGTNRCLAGTGADMEEMRRRVDVVFREEVVSWKEVDVRVTPLLTSFEQALALPPATGTDGAMMVWPPNRAAF